MRSSTIYRINDDLLVINNTFRFLVYNLDSNSGIEIIFHEHNINNLYVDKSL